MCLRATTLAVVLGSNELCCVANNPITYARKNPRAFYGDLCRARGVFVSLFCRRIRPLCTVCVCVCVCMPYLYTGQKGFCAGFRRERVKSVERFFALIPNTNAILRSPPQTTHALLCVSYASRISTLTSRADACAPSVFTACSLPRKSVNNRVRAIRTVYRPR